MAKSTPKFLSASGLVWTGHGYLTGLLVGMDNVNDPQITVYDNTVGSGTAIVPTSNLDASAKGFNGFTRAEIEFNTGCYVLIEASGGGAFADTIEVVALIEGGLKQ